MKLRLYCDQRYRSSNKDFGFAKIFIGFLVVRQDFGLTERDWDR